MFKKSMSSILLWILWLFVSISGLSIGLAIGLSLMGADWTLRPLFILIGLSIGGLLMGFGQWALLRTRANSTWMWIPATALGLPLGIFIGFWINQFLPRFIFVFDRQDVFIMSSIAGILTGRFQWLAVHKKLKGSLNWIVVSALSWGIGITLAFYLLDTYRNSIDFDFGFGNYASLGIIIGLVVGAISGVFVESTLMNSRFESDSPIQKAS